MITARVLPCLLLAGALGAARPAHAATDRPEPSRLAYRHAVWGTGGDGLLAQRAIDRSWGPSEDSVYVTVDIPGWKSEPLATTLSAIVPGTGQFYTGEGMGWVFLAAEAAGWGGWLWYRHDAHRLRGDAGAVAGTPGDDASGWSFSRWASATESDPAEIEALYAADREAFYNSIGSDPRYQAGWDSDADRTRFSDLRIRADQRLSRAHVYSTALWINHLVAAANALRAARLHNLPLNRTIGIRFDGRMRHGGADVTLALERKF